MAEKELEATKEQIERVEKIAHELEEIVKKNNITIIYAGLHEGLTSHYFSGFIGKSSPSILKALMRSFISAKEEMLDDLKNIFKGIGE